MTFEPARAAFRRVVGRNTSPAMVVASLALFVALTGTSVADVTQLVAPNSVGAAQLKKNAVTSPKVRNGSLRLVDFARRDRTLLKGETGATGPKGDRGDKGERGDRGESGAQGPPGLSDVLFVSGSSAFDSSSVKSTGATCPAGRVLVGGSAGTFGATGHVALLQSRPLAGSWEVLAAEIPPNSTTSSWGLTAYAACARVQS